MKIKTAEEILDSKIFESLKPDNIYKTEPIIEAMKEYAEQFIDLAAEEASIRSNGEWVSSNVEVNKESILKVKQLIK